MQPTRFYPTVVALIKRTISFDPPPAGGPVVQIMGGAHLVIGGGDLPGAGNGNSMLEFLRYGYSTLGGSLESPAATGLSSSQRLYEIHDNLAATLLPFSGKLDSYPRALQLSTGDILISHDVITRTPAYPPGHGDGFWGVLRLYGPYSTGAARCEFWRCSPQKAYDRNYGSCVLLHEIGALDRVLVFGGLDYVNNQPLPTKFATNSVEEFVPEQGHQSPGGPIVNGVWMQKSPLINARTDSNAVILPNGKVLITGGFSQRTTQGGVNTDTPVFEPELYDPENRPSSPTTINGSSTLMNTPNSVPTAGSTPQPTARLYHHVAVLLPDGSVFIAGGEEPAPGVLAADGEFSGEVFLPDYLDPSKKRAYIARAPSSIAMNTVGSSASTFQVLVGDMNSGQELHVERVVLTRPGAVTHFFDNDQRYIELSHTLSPTITDTQIINVIAPEENLTPPGVYMLWVITSNSTANGELIPTAAKFVWIS